MLRKKLKAMRKVQLGMAFKPHAPAIGGDIFGFGRYAVRGAVDAAEAAIPARWEPPLHALVGEVRERMAERRQLPVEDREQARRIEVEDHVVDAPVAMHERDAAVVGGGNLSASHAIRRSISVDLAVSLARY